LSAEAQAKVDRALVAKKDFSEQTQNLIIQKQTGSDMPERFTYE
jgi:hypothetical protein